MVKINTNMPSTVGATTANNITVRLSLIRSDNNGPSTGTSTGTGLTSSATTGFVFRTIRNAPRSGGLRIEGGGTGPQVSRGLPLLFGGDASTSTPASTPIDPATSTNVPEVPRRMRQVEDKTRTVAYSFSSGQPTFRTGSWQGYFSDKRYQR